MCVGVVIQITIGILKVVDLKRAQQRNNGVNIVEN